MPKHITHFSAGGKSIRCDHCSNQTFFAGRAQLNTPGMSFLNLDWANKSAYTLTCEACSRIQWYGNKPQRESQTKSSE